VIPPIDAPFGAPILHASLFKCWLPLVLTPLVLVGYEQRGSLSVRLARAYAALLVLCIVAFGALDLARAWRNVADPPEWDLRAFWVMARVSAERADFYDPREMHRVAESHERADPPLRPSPEFTREILDVGSLYPPPTMLWMAPFGHLDLRTAAALWYVVLGAALGAAIVALRRAFFPDGGRLELAVVATLVLMLRATYSMVAFGQTSVLLLLALALFWRRRDQASGGLWLAAGFLVKPIFAFFLLYPALRRNWRAVALCMAALAAATALSAAVFGPRTLVTYVVDNPASRVPPWLYTTTVNQSLVAWVVRLTAHDFTRGSPLAYPPFVAGAAAIVALTAWLAWRVGRERGALALSMLVPAALLVYPQSLDHYGMLLLVPMLHVWTRRRDMRLDRTFVIVLLSTMYALVRYDAGSIMALATALMWLVLVVVGVRLAGRKAAASSPATPAFARP
jgi:hypothetical protein